MLLGETGCQVTKIEVELVLCPVTLVGARRGAGKDHNGKKFNV